MKYNLHVDELLTANIGLVALLNSEHFEILFDQQVKTVNKTSGFKANLTGANDR